MYVDEEKVFKKQPTSMSCYILAFPDNSSNKTTWKIDPNEY